MNADAPITGLLGKWAKGEKAALNEVIELVYRELYIQAERAMARERPNHTLDPPALVNEVYLRLCNLRNMNWPNRSAFFAFAAKQMRRVLVDHARARDADKRGGGEQLRVTLAQAELNQEEPIIGVILLDQAIRHVEAVSKELAALVEMRLICQLTEVEAAEALRMSRATVQRKWAVAKRLLVEFLTEKEYIK